MRKYKIITRKVWTWKSVCREEKIEVPLWYIKFLRWVFIADERIIEEEIQEGKDKAFWSADKDARNIKENLMQQKLHELGFEVISNLPVAKEFKEGDLPTQFDCHKPFEIVKIK